MAISLEENDHGLYKCHNCDCVFEGHPREGFGFNLEGGDVTDDENYVFFEDGKKIIVGAKVWACHNEDEPCTSSSDTTFSPVVCHMWVCSCGRKYTFDEDGCYDHSYSSSEAAQASAKECPCGKNRDDVDPELPKKSKMKASDFDVVAPPAPIVFDTSKLTTSTTTGSYSLGGLTMTGTTAYHNSNSNVIQMPNGSTITGHVTAVQMEHDGYSTTYTVTMHAA